MTPQAAFCSRKFSRPSRHMRSSAFGPWSGRFLRFRHFGDNIYLALLGQKTDAKMTTRGAFAPENLASTAKFSP